MELLKRLVFLAFLFGSAAFGQTPDPELEKEVYRQLIPALADSLFIDLWKSPPPPPPPPVNMSRKDSIEHQEEVERLRKKYEEEIKVLDADTTRIVLAVGDSTYTGLDNGDLDKFRAHFGLSKDLGIDPDTLIENEIDLENITPQQKFSFKYRSEFPEGREIWGKEYDFRFSGAIFLSRILFDDSRSYGILTGGYACGKLCGHCFRIFIKRVDGAWKIEEIAVTCIS